MTFDEFYEQEMLTAERLVAEPTGELGYGRDLACISDITEDLAETDPDTAQGIGEGILRRLQTPRGTLGAMDDDANYGFDVIGGLNRATTDDELRSFEAQIKGECLKDDRIENLTVKVAFSFSTSSLDITMRVTPADPSTSAFTLVFAVDPAGTVLLKEIG